MDWIIVGLVEFIWHFGPRPSMNLFIRFPLVIMLRIVDLDSVTVRGGSSLFNFTAA